MVSFKVSLFLRTKRVCVREALFLLITISSPKLQNAPLGVNIFHSAELALLLESLESPKCLYIHNSMIFPFWISDLYFQLFVPLITCKSMFLIKCVNSESKTCLVKKQLRFKKKNAPRNAIFDTRCKSTDAKRSLGYHLDHMIIKGVDVADEKWSTTWNQEWLVW